MTGFVRRTANWLGRHSLPAAAVSVVVIGAAGGGIGYSVAGQRSTASPLASTTTPSTSATRATTGTTPAAGSTRKLGATVVARILAKLSAETGVPAATIRTDLKTMSVNDIITAAGKDPAVVETDLLAQLKTVGDRAVTAGRISQQQETAWLAMAQPEVHKLMADAPAQRAADVAALLKTLRAHHAAATTPAP